MPDALLHHSDRDTPPDEATPDWDNSPSFYCFNFLTQGVDPHGSCDNFGAFASLYAAHGADAHLLKRRVIQLASIVWFYLPSELDEIRPVNKNVQLLMD